MSESMPIMTFAAWRFCSGGVEKNKMLTSILRHLLSGYIGIGLCDCAVQENSLALANLKKIKSTMN